MIEIKRFNSKSVVVYHGLGGSPSQDRIDCLESMGYKVIYPHIDYELEWKKDRCRSVFDTQVELAKNVDLIIGLSLGGYMAFELSGVLNKNCILINPALDRDRTKLEIKHFDINRGDEYGFIDVYLGEYDTLIDKSITLKYLRSIGVDFKYSIVSGMEHRTPIEYFSEIINKSKIV